MEDITSKEEQISRRQFSRLFCGEIMHMCRVDDAMNDTSWDEVVLDDILHRVYPNNKLTTEKIKVILVMLGWSTDILFFDKSPNKQVNDWLFPFIADHISMAAYVQIRQAEIPDPTKTVIQFYNKFCTHNSNAPLRIPTLDVYDLYVSWCYNTNRHPMTMKTFHNAFSKLGVVKTKGYCNGKSGVVYYLLKLNSEEVLADEQQEISPTETEQETEDSPKPIRNVSRTRAAIHERSIQRETPDVPNDEEGQNISAIDGRDDHDDEPNDSVVISRDEAKFTQQIPSTPENRDAVDSSTQNFTNQFPQLKDFATTESTKTGAIKAPSIQPTKSKSIQYPNDTTNIIGRLKQLPIGFRPTFDEIRISCKIAMDPFTEEQFTAMASDAGFHFTPEQTHDLYDFLIEYAKADLRELKKGAIQ